MTLLVETIIKYYNSLCNALNISVNTNTRTHMSLITLLSRLAELFPPQDYPNRLERYLAARQPKTAAEVEYWQRQFESQEHRGLSI